MLSWIISALGIGGFGLACAFIPGFAARALEIATGIVKSVLAIVAEYPWQAALIASLCLSGWLWRGRQAARVDAAHWQTAFADQKAEYEKAQELAKSAQADANRREFHMKTLLAEKTDDLSRISTERTRIAVADYARRNPVRVCRQAADSATSGTSGPGVPGDPGQPAREEAHADWVAITRPDLDALADAAVQGAVKTEFLNAVVAAGWGVPQSKVPEPAF